MPYAVAADLKDRWQAFPPGLPDKVVDTLLEDAANRPVFFGADDSYRACAKYPASNMMASTSGPVRYPCILRGSKFIYPITASHNATVPMVTFSLRGCSHTWISVTVNILPNGVVMMSFGCRLGVCLRKYTAGWVVTIVL